MIRARSLLERLPRAILFLDVVESTRLIEVDEEGVVHRWLDVVEKLKAGPIAKHGETRLVKVLGDGLLMEAENANVAVSLAQDLLAAFDAESDDPDSILQVRIGINVGEVIRSVDDDIYGNDVNIAFRLLSVAQPGEIVATAQVRDALSDELDAGFEDLGECYLRNVVRPVRVFRVHPKGWTRRVRANLTDADLMPTVAVIPFAQRNPAVDHFALGEVLADAMISTLARSADINVISGLSTTRFRMREATLTEIGTALAADFVITGIYSSDGQHATLDVEMTEVRTGVVVWSERLVEKVADLVQPQNPIQALVSRAHSAILKRETDRALTSRMPTLESYALLMGAVSLMHRLTLHEIELDGALACPASCSGVDRSARSRGTDGAVMHPPSAGPGRVARPRNGRRGLRPEQPAAQAGRRRTDLQRCAGSQPERRARAAVAWNALCLSRRGEGGDPGYRTRAAPRAA
jgi:adenylate cyclase